MVPDAGSLAHVMSLYGYPFIMAIVLVGSMGVPLPLGLALVLLGALSVERGGPDIVVLVLSGTAASVAGDLADYALGRLGGARLLRWLYHHQRRWLGRPLVHASQLLRRYGGVVIFLSRFLFTAVASPISLLVGISRMRLTRFLLWDIAGEAIFVAGNLLVGRFLGGSLEEQGDLAPLLWALGAASVALPLAARLGRHLWHIYRGRRPALPVVGGFAPEPPVEPASPLAR